MPNRGTNVKKSTLAVTATAGLIGGLLCFAGGAAEAQADAGAPMTQTSLLRFDEIQLAGLAVDNAVLGTRGDQYLGDAGRFDEGCLGEKTMRNITGSKEYPAPGAAKPYFDGTWTSTLDKDVWLSESIAEGKNDAKTTRYVQSMFNGIFDVKSCQQDPDQGDYYGPAHSVKVGTGSGTYFIDYHSDGTSDGGGVAVIRDGNRFGYVDLMFGQGKPGATLRSLTAAAVADLS